MPLKPSTSAPRQPTAPSTTGERDSPTPSQLDILAERNERFATPTPFARAAFVLAIVGVITLLVAVRWWVAQPSDSGLPSTAVSRPVATSTGASNGPAPDVLPRLVVAPAAAPSAVAAQAQASVPAPSPAEHAGKAQARRVADVRAKASPAPAQRQQRDIDKPRDLTAATASAAETRGGAGPAASGAETASRPRAEGAGAGAGVREFCVARGNIVSELLCRTRECRKPERAKDATCLRLKEIEEAQQRVPSQ